MGGGLSLAAGCELRATLPSGSSKGGRSDGTKGGHVGYAGGGEGSQDEEEDSEPPDLARRAAVVGLLQIHLWRIRAAGGQLSEMSQQVEATREVWELFLDGTRNRTVRLNLQATIMTLALTVTAVPASLAGMNIPNGFEASHPALFWGLAGTLAAVSAGTWAHFMGVFRSGTSRTGARVDDLRALRFVLQRMDELDDVMRAKGGSGKSGAGVRSRDELVRALQEAGPELNAMEGRGSAGGAEGGVSGLRGWGAAREEGEEGRGGTDWV